eukprot:scpid96774/ scgid12408/ 
MGNISSSAARLVCDWRTKLRVTRAHRRHARERRRKQRAENEYHNVRHSTHQQMKPKFNQQTGQKTQQHHQQQYQQGQPPHNQHQPHIARELLQVTGDKAPAKSLLPILIAQMEAEQVLRELFEAYMTLLSADLQALNNCYRLCGPREALLMLGHMSGRGDTCYA